jgi:hypothetical protein
MNLCKVFYSLRMHKRICHLGRISLFKTGNKGTFLRNSFTNFVFQNFANDDETCVTFTNNEAGWSPLMWVRSISALSLRLEP